MQMPGTVVKSKELSVIEKNPAYLFTIKQLRSRNFTNNLPFLILSEKLPEGQVYREFPDGRIELQQMAAGGPSFTFTVLRQLSSTEAGKVRKAHGLQ